MCPFYLLDFPFGLTGASLGASPSPPREEEEEIPSSSTAPLICLTSPTLPSLPPPPLLPSNPLLLVWWLLYPATTDCGVLSCDLLRVSDFSSDEPKDDSPGKLPCSIIPGSLLPGSSLAWVADVCDGTLPWERDLGTEALTIGPRRLPVVPPVRYGDW